LDKSNRKNTITCNDCGAEILVPPDIQDNEILSCPGCGVEFVVHKLPGEKIEAVDLQLEGKVDWGE
jgi:DNA-directed RNA polymerase subunit RPC12/RpoP